MLKRTVQRNRWIAIAFATLYAAGARTLSAESALPDRELPSNPQELPQIVFENFDARHFWQALGRKARRRATGNARYPLHGTQPLFADVLIAVTPSGCESPVLLAWYDFRDPKAEEDFQGLMAEYLGRATCGIDIKGESSHTGPIWVHARLGTVTQSHDKIGRKRADFYDELTENVINTGLPVSVENVQKRIAQCRTGCSPYVAAFVALSFAAAESYDAIGHFATADRFRFQAINWATEMEYFRRRRISYVLEHVLRAVERSRELLDDDGRATVRSLASLAPKLSRYMDKKTWATFEGALNNAVAETARNTLQYTKTIELNPDVLESQRLAFGSASIDLEYFRITGFEGEIKHIVFKCSEDDYAFALNDTGWKLRPKGQDACVMRVWGKPESSLSIELAGQVASIQSPFSQRNTTAEHQEITKLVADALHIRSGRLE